VLAIFEGSLELIRVKVRCLDLAGTRTRVLESERGPTDRPAILLIHGGGVTADTWLCNVDELGADRLVIAPDLIGHGFSWPRRFSGRSPTAVILEHLLEVIDAYGLSKLIVIGSSYGAQLAALVYFARPLSVYKLVLTSSASVFHPRDELQKALLAAGANASAARDSLTTSSCRLRLKNICHPHSVIPEAVLLPQVTSWSFPEFMAADQERRSLSLDMNLSEPYRVLERLESINVETLVIWGRDDPRGRIEHARANITRFPQARLVEFDRCGHLPYLEHPTRFNQLVAEFCAK